MNDILHKAQGEIQQLRQRISDIEAKLSEAQGDSLTGWLASYSEFSAIFEQRGVFYTEHCLKVILEGLGIGKGCFYKDRLKVSAGFKIGLTALARAPRRAVKR